MTILTAVFLAATQAPVFYLDNVPCFSYAPGHYECELNQQFKLCKDSDNGLICTRYVSKCKDCTGV